VEAIKGEIVAAVPINGHSPAAPQHQNVMLPIG